jgi:hypothetical protein
MFIRLTYTSSYKLSFYVISYKLSTYTIQPIRFRKLFSYLYSFFSENGSLGWDVPTMKQLCTSCVTYKKKWDNGIISSWGGYATNKECLWIHHWVLLQFVHPSFSVPCKTDFNERHADGISVYNFKHESWTQFIRAMDDELVSEYFKVHNEYPRFGIVWLGTQTLPVF